MGRLSLLEQRMSWDVFDLALLLRNPDASRAKINGVRFDALIGVELDTI